MCMRAAYPKLLALFKAIMKHNKEAKKAKQRKVGGSTSRIQCVLYLSPGNNTWRIATARNRRIATGTATLRCAPFYSVTLPYAQPLARAAGHWLFLVFHFNATFERSRLACRLRLADGQVANIVCSAGRVRGVSMPCNHV
eukprot:118427-Chlamydomonas_euryale.AAC.1